MTREARARQLIDAARAVLNEKGYENLVLADVAKRAGIVEGAIYRHFSGKRELMITAAEAWFEEILGEVRPDASITATADRLRHVVARALTLIRQEPALARFVLSDVRADPAYRTMRLYDLNRRYASAVMDVLRDAVEAGEFNDDVPVALLRDMIFGCIERQTWSFLHGQGDFPPDDAADAIARLIYRGMVAAPMEAGKQGLDGALRRIEDVAGRIERAAATFETSSGP